MPCPWPMSDLFGRQWGGASDASLSLVLYLNRYNLDMN